MTAHRTATARTVAPAADVHAEAAIISACLIRGDIPAELRTLPPAAFFAEAHRQIWAAALSVVGQGVPVDVVTVGSALRDANRLAQVGGMGYLTEVLNAAPAVSDVALAAYAATVRDRATVRRVAREAEEITAAARTGSTLGELVTRVDALRARLDDARPSRLPTIDASGIAAPLPPIPWLCQGLALAPGRPALLAGYGFSAKSLVAQALALAVASGAPLFGLFRVRRGRVLHLDYEQGRRLTAERYQRLARAAGIDLAEVGDGLRVAIHPRLALDVATAEDELAREADGHALVVIDSLTCAIPSLDENSREIAAPLYALGRASERTGATIVVIHHSRKPSKDAPGGAAMAIRGSSAIYGAVDSAFVFAAAKGEPVRVEHVRSPQTGILVPDFGLAIEDVEIDGDPRAGLSVRHLEREQLDAAEEDRHEAAEARVEREILAVLAAGPFVGGRGALQKALRGRRDLVLGVLGRLVAEGRVAEDGSYHQRTLRLAGGPP